MIKSEESSFASRKVTPTSTIREDSKAPTAPAVPPKTEKKFEKFLEEDSEDKEKQGLSKKKKKGTIFDMSKMDKKITTPPPVTAIPNADTTTAIQHADTTDKPEQPKPQKSIFDFSNEHVPKDAKDAKVKPMYRTTEKTELQENLGLPKKPITKPKMPFPNVEEKDTVAQPKVGKFENKETKAPLFTDKKTETTDKKPEFFDKKPEIADKKPVFADKQTTKAETTQKKGDLPQQPLTNTQQTTTSPQDKIAASFAENTVLTNAGTTPTTRTAEIQEIVNQLVSQIQTTTTAQGRTDITLTVQHPPVFEGSTITVSEFDTAKGEFNLTFANLSREAKNILDIQQNQHVLKNILESKGYNLHIITTTEKTLEETNLGQTADEGNRYQDQEKQQQEQEKQKDEYFAFNEDNENA